jgi:hypothetical protein
MSAPTVGIPTIPIYDYVYKYAVAGGNDVWKWQRAGTFAWAHAATKEEAIHQICLDARKQGACAHARDISQLRPGKEEVLQEVQAP